MIKNRHFSKHFTYFYTISKRHHFEFFKSTLFISIGGFPNEISNQNKISYFLLYDNIKRYLILVLISIGNLPSQCDSLKWIYPSYFSKFRLFLGFLDKPLSIIV